jgi:hypothetical protein
VSHEAVWGAVRCGVASVCKQLVVVVILSKSAAIGIAAETSDQRQQIASW